jgi:hypothetical protein
MNNQIDQLMVKAGAYFGGEGVVYDNFDPKKFAELIVRECANISDASFHNGSAGYLAILKHFGVEE